MEHFAARGHRVIGVDLRGHGKSDKPQQKYSIASYADDVAWLTRELELRRPILIGHSMGGTTAFEAAGRYPEFFEGAVVIDGSVTPTDRAREAMGNFIEGLRKDDYRDLFRDFIGRAFFTETDDPERKKQILDRMLETPRHVMIPAFEGVATYDAVAAARGLRCPVLYIAANELPPRSDVAVLRSLAPRTMFAQTAGSGHFCQLEVPEQINAMIERFIDLAARAEIGGPSARTAEKAV
jgi:pimeloyl-ACP methyl ester carboxylesterase